MTWYLEVEVADHSGSSGVCRVLVCSVSLFSVCVDESASFTLGPWDLLCVKMGPPVFSVCLRLGVGVKGLCGNGLELSGLTSGLCMGGGGRPCGRRVVVHCSCLSSHS